MKERGNSCKISPEEVDAEAEAANKFLSKQKSA